MSAKKNKALASKLIDDLLGKEESVGSLPTVPGDDDSTSPVTPEPEKHEPSQKSKSEAKSSVGRFAPLRSATPGQVNSTEALLTQSENLRIAQQRLLQLEQEIQRLRKDNEQLASAGETMRRRADELIVKYEQVNSRFEKLKNTSEEERELLHKSLEAKTKELERVKTELEDMQGRLANNLNKVRVRERELENRLELVKMENSALLRSKDEIILDLKRQMDHMNMEMDNFRVKGQEHGKQLANKQELIRRTVKALRIALSLLEGEEEQQDKKAK